MWYHEIHTYCTCWGIALMIIFLAMALRQDKAAWIRWHIFFQKFFKITLEKTKNIAIFLSIIMQMQTEIFLILFVRHIYILRWKCVSCYVCACEMSFKQPVRKWFISLCLRVCLQKGVKSSTGKKVFLVSLFASGGKLTKERSSTQFTIAEWTVEVCLLHYRLADLRKYVTDRI